MERFRAFWGQVFTPVARLLLRLGVSPDVVTIIGTVGVCAAALVFFPRGDFLVGVLVIVASPWDSSRLVIVGRAVVLAGGAARAPGGTRGRTSVR